jgi:hypothetical protein
METQAEAQEAASEPVARGGLKAWLANLGGQAALAFGALVVFLLFELVGWALFVAGAAILLYALGRRMGWPAGVLLLFAMIAGAGVTIQLTQSFGRIALIEGLLIGGGAALGVIGPKWKSAATTLFILAAAIAPHVIFVIVYDIAAQGGEPAALPAVFREYEDLAVWLHDHVAKRMGLSPSIAFLLTLLAIAIAFRTGDTRLSRWTGRYRLWTGRVSLVILGMCSFTLFSGTPAGRWSPDTQRRLAAVMRVGKAYEVKRFLATELVAEVRRDPGAYVAQIADATARLSALAHQAVPAGDPRVLAGKMAEPAAAAMADQVTSGLGAATPPPAAAAADEPQATLVEIREEAAAAVANRKGAELARAELNGQVTKLIGKGGAAALAAAGLHVDQALMEKVSGLFIDKVYDRAGEWATARLIATARPRIGQVRELADILRGRLRTAFADRGLAEHAMESHESALKARVRELRIEEVEQVRERELIREERAKERVAEHAIEPMPHMVH